MDVIKATLRERQISPELVKKTKHYYHHYLTSCSNPVTEWRILAELCPSLRQEARMLLHPNPYPNPTPNPLPLPPSP